ncbi:HD domain-containing protein [Ktedonosporobacter rubrisoli]|uniref:HD domain-containing protein n=1 Tax=Ktedonosporobacter rubrisoli TaxID=2509675 RepID=A0A4P6K113_KTERU|nr:HD domain-containing protein [Ktedonosporobacter rubrisoli]QBD81513.1 HD domain-containing protein [Ktedonosporobacter rubrisoli]
MDTRTERSKGAHSKHQMPETELSADTVVVGAEMRQFWVDAENLPLLPDMRPTSTVRDSLYELIPLGPREEKLISTQPFLRLQQVKQLGFVYRVWPGATHTRYEHSLGSYHLAVRALRALLQRGEAGGLDGVSVKSIQALVVATLLHDIGHYPYSHTIEELGHPIVRHEQVGRSIIEKSEIATILERDYQLAPDRVANFIDPQKSTRWPEDDALLSHLLSGALDVDKLDYLPRDARGCNVPYGGVDVSRLLGALRVHPDVRGQRQIVVTHKGISPLHSLLHARQEMFDNIYWHHTIRALQIMLVRAVQDALTEGNITAEQLVGHDDESLLMALLEPQMPASSRALAEALKLRRPYKEILEVSRLAGRLFHRLEALFWDAERRRRIEKALTAELASALNTEIADYEILFDIPRPEKWEMNVWIWFEQPPVGMETLMPWVEVTGLQPDDLARYEQHQRRIRLVAAERLRPLLLEHKDDLLLPTLDQLL